MKDIERVDVFLDDSVCKKLFGGKKIFIFGTGIDAERASDVLSGVVEIMFYVDNNRHGKGHYFHGKETISVEQCLERRDAGQPILIASYKYATEICNQMEQYGLIAGADFYVWDEYHIFKGDKITADYIDFLQCIWKRSSEKERKGIVIVPFYSRRDYLSVLYAYCGNFWAEKLEADIYAYSGFGADCSNASDVDKKIYHAFNVKGLIDSALSESQREEADKICDSIWNQIMTWEDWKNITIYGIRFGTTMIRHLLRVFIPSFDVKSSQMYSFFKQEVDTVVFWKHYIFENDIKVVFLLDGVSWDGYIRDIAMTKGIPVYIFNDVTSRATLDYCQGTPYQYYRDMWGQLTPYEQDYGIRWAKEHIVKRLHGGTEELPVWDKKNFAFGEHKQDRAVLDVNDKIKLMICPHIFEEDCFYCGEQIFDNNYFAWLCHLGELSERTPNYDWYLKMHPSSARRDFIIINMILNKYPNIKKIPENVSPVQLRDEGMAYALTVYGSIGHEYPEIGIQVINAGLNPHSAFDFTWNPKTKEEYDDLIMNLDKLKPKQDREGLYQFYSLNYLYYDWEYIPWRSLLFKNPLLGMDRFGLEAEGLSPGTWVYEEYMKEWTKERHEEILSQLDGIFKKLDEWSPKVLYKRKDCKERIEKEFGNNAT